MLLSSFCKFAPPINFEQSTLYFFHFERKCTVYKLEIQNTAVDEPFMSWKLKTPRWKCLKSNKCSIYQGKWKKYAINREKTTKNWKNNRWRNNSAAWTGFSSFEYLINTREMENNGINDQFSVVKGNKMYLTSQTPWCLQFSWHILTFYRGENVFNGKRYQRSSFRVISGCLYSSTPTYNLRA